MVGVRFSHPLLKTAELQRFFHSIGKIDKVAYNMKYIWKYDSPIGKILMAADRDGLTELWFENQKYFVSQLKKEEYAEKNLPVFERTIQWLDIYFDGGIPEFTPQLHQEGTTFQKMVWEILQQIPYGETVTYKEIACQIAKQRGIAQMSAQAVGGAVGHNTIAIIVPCHRVIGSNGKLTGYAGGLEKKAYLLSLEKGRKG